VLDGLIEEEPGVYLVVGTSSSPNLAVTEGAVQPQHAGGWTDIVLVRIDTRFPTAAFDASPASGPAPLVVSFDGSPSRPFEGNGLSGVFLWDFGDDGSSQGEQVEHEYGAGPFGGVGRYVARLTVESNRGLASTVSDEVTAYLPSDGDLTPWTPIDVGSPTFPGGTRGSRETPRHDLELCGGGNGLLGSRAAFHFLHQKVSGDFDLSAQVEALFGTKPGARASLGLMVRDGLGVATNTKHFTFVVERQTGFGANESPKLARYWRADRSRSEDLAELDTMESWLRVTRRGAEFVCSTSADGGTWTLLGDPVVIEELPETVDVGVALTKTEPSTRPSAFMPIVAGVSSLELRVAGAGETLFVRGDCNNDGAVNISDATCILNWLFAGEADPVCVATTNTNGDDAANITDATYLLNHLFGGGEAPVSPFPDCGPGMLPADAELGCANPPDCQ
jgi:PKD repeat protein